MAEEGKKISFGFTKSIKKPMLDKQVLQEKKKVDYIECLDEKAIKVIEKEENKEKPLVVPLLKSIPWHDRIINKINADIYTAKVENKDIDIARIKEEPKILHNGELTKINEGVSTIAITTKPFNEKETVILENQAAKEIIEDLKSIDKDENKSINLIVPLAERRNLIGADESVFEDYEAVPINDYGPAMLRGMGWKGPSDGVGRNPRVVTHIVKEPRPAGMGLGADLPSSQKQNRKVSKEEEELKIMKGSFVKFISGKRRNTYGQIESFDNAGRLIVKLALGGDIISVNESIIRAVTATEYSKNSKVLNAAKYEEHKNKESESKRRSVSLEHFNSDNGDSDTRDKERKRKKNDIGYKSKKSRKKSKDRRRDSSDSDSEKKGRKRKRSSSSDRTKKAKKSKKHKEKDKEHKRRKDKLSRHSESSDRRKSHKHRRSRSSSKR